MSVSIPSPSISVPTSHSIPKTPQPVTSTSLPSTHDQPTISSTTPQPQIDDRETQEPNTENNTQNTDITMESREITPSPLSPSTSLTPSSPRSSALESGSANGSTSISATESMAGVGDSSNSSQNIQNVDTKEVDVDRFLKKIEMEKKMQALQQRLELASIKATNGWKDMSLKEIETKLPPTPLRTRKSQLLPSSPITTSPISPSRSGTIPYEPPSPSRPWQLIDVLWQPLPPPSHGRYPASPSSPRKRSRTDDHDLSSSNGYSRLNGLGLPLSPHRKISFSQNSTNTSHRRASSSISTVVDRTHIYDRDNQAGPSSPLRHRFEDAMSVPKKKRSQSHSYTNSPNTNSNYRRSREILGSGGGTPSTTSQDVDAAKALTHMLSSGGGGNLSDDDIHRSQKINQGPLLLPSMLESKSLPIPEAFKRNGSISPTLLPINLPKINKTNNSNNTPKSRGKRIDSTNNSTPNTNSSSKTTNQRSKTPNSVEQRGEEDKNAAELMMFLAHSPSPMKTLNRGSRDDNDNDDDVPRPSIGMAARVLFSDSSSSSNDQNIKRSTSPISPIERISSNNNGIGHINTSNLALAPPITPGS
ncbi:uncharacterized protein L201_002602 [Kwoniella dendrophila CBS 6074]|uniref:Uncharacterized protein n=1 Tax=Kwoniella dendrophila CBS 6074 TaxID=1295534 RepID=A0AAX4JT65_9TREE